MKKIFVLEILAMLVLCGCESIQVDRCGTIDQTEKTMSVPPGNLGLTGDVKRALKSNGWRLYVIAKGKEVTTKGEETDETVWAAKSRYRMLLDWVQVDVDLLLNPIYRFNLSLSDNRTGEEMISISGKRVSGERAAEEFLKELLK